MSKLEKEKFSKLMNVGSVIVADERNGYLAGVDVLVEGRSVNFIIY